MRILLALAACLLLAVPVLASPKVIEDGDFQHFPPLSSWPPGKTKYHSGGTNVYLESGDTVGSFRVSGGPAYLFYWAPQYAVFPSGVTLELVNNGTIFTTLSTVPGQQYVIEVYLRSDVEGSKDVNFFATIDGDRIPIIMPLHGLAHALFTAKNSSPQLGFRRTNPQGVGPFFFYIHVRPWNAAVEAVKPDIERVYSGRTHFYLVKDSGGLLGTFADGFTARLGPETEPLDSAAYEATVKQDMATTPDFTFTLQDISLTADGATITLSEALRGEARGDDGVNHHLQVDRTVTEELVRSGNSWKVKSRRVLQSVSRQDGKVMALPPDPAR